MFRRPPSAPAPALSIKTNKAYCDEHADWEASRKKRGGDGERGGRGGSVGGGGGIFFPALIEREIAPTKDLTYSEHRRHRDRRKARQEYKTRSGSEVASPPSHPI